MTEANPTALAAVNQAPESGASSDYWHALIDEKAAAAFLGLTKRTLQAHRQKGGGARYVRLSSRCSG